MSLRKICLAGAAAALFPVAAMAQSPAAVDRGFYLHLGGGVGWAESADLDGFGGNIGMDNPGWAGVAAIGYDFGQFRVELEGMYLNNNPDIGSQLEVYGGFLNLLYEFDFGFPLKPHIGVGLGYLRYDLKPFQKDWSLALQGIAGLEYSITPNIAVFADYRYVNNEWIQSSDVETDHHLVLAGLRFTFGAPRPAATPVAAPPPPPPPVARPAPPPPPPAAAPIARSYLVFFDFDRSNLTPEGTRIVQTAAQNARAGGVTRIMVTGHADRSGSPQYNMGLSRRRAESVRAELIRSGVSPNEISVAARGESDPLVPTPDGVREPQNRRVEIVFQ